LKSRFLASYPTTQILITYVNGVRHLAEFLPDVRMQFVRDAGATLDGIKEVIARKQKEAHK
jgi:hypothetical protein